MNVKVLIWVQDRQRSVLGSEDVSLSYCDVSIPPEGPIKRGCDGPPGSSSPYTRYPVELKVRYVLSTIPYDSSSPLSL